MSSQQRDRPGDAPRDARSGAVDPGARAEHSDEDDPATEPGADPNADFGERSPTVPRLRVQRITQPVPIVDASGLPIGEAPPARRPCLLVLSGPRVGELLPVGGDGRTLIIGRDPEAGLALLDEGVSRRHAGVTLEGETVRLVDYGSRNGTWFDGQRVESRLLVEGDKFRVGQTTVVKFTWQERAEVELRRKLLDAALRDGLTRAFNSRYFLERLQAELACAVRLGASLALLYADVDHLDYINRLIGREGGDSILRKTAALLDGSLRVDDVLGRRGGDGFAVIARETGVDGGVRLAERLRGTIAEASFTHQGRPLEVRLSIGVAALPGHTGRGAAAGAPPSELPPLSLLEALIADARAALDRARAEGRNRVASTLRPNDATAPANHGAGEGDGQALRL